MPDKMRWEEELLSLAKIQKEVIDFLYESHGQAFNEANQILNDLIRKWEEV